ncbi:MAG: ribbon-helix-helix domain-containing protein [Planctomycetota bacterium]|nr:ribbon-helix-helix domain-containing protein [Planctomycetota bacterium]
MKTITVRISRELQKRLDALCRRERRSRSDVVRDALRRYIALERLRPVRRALGPYAEARGFLTDEDVFKAVS